MNELQKQEEEMYIKLYERALKRYSDPEFRRKCEEWEKEQKYA